MLYNGQIAKRCWRVQNEGTVARPLDKELLSAEDVAALIGVKETTVWRWCRCATRTP